MKRETFGGELAPNVHTLLSEGRFELRMMPRFEEFVRWLETSPVIVNDIGLRNIVLSDRVGSAPRFVLIDGYGETAAVPFKSWSSRWNRWDKRKKIRSIFLQVRERQKDCGRIKLEDVAA